jgi:5-methylcytosine-specific restriction endonuclease McrA
MTKRDEFSPQVKDAALQRNMKEFGFPICEVCKAMIKKGQFQVDHIKPCWEGGKGTLDNARIICLPCHQPKSAEEGRVTQAADRKGRKDRGIKTVKRKIPAHVDPWGKGLRRSS